MHLLYIDPGTGSMLFALLVSLIGAVVYGAKSLWIKLKYNSKSGNGKNENSESIPIAIFSDDKRYWNVFGPICREFEKREYPLTFMTASPDDPALKEDFKYVKTEFIGEDNKAFAKLNFLKADILLATTPGLDVYQWKRSKDVKYYVHILHGACYSMMYKMFGLDYYDSILLTGDYQIQPIRQLEKLRNLPEKELKVIGQPYMDELYKRYKNSNAEKGDKLTVLLAPSWGKGAILSRYGEKIIDALINTGYEIIIRPHPQSFVSEKEMLDNLMNKYSDIEWNRDSDNFEAMLRADIMISDFSGIIMDFSLIYGKPLIYSEADVDLAPYDACWLDEKPWIIKTLPKIGAELKENDFSDLKNIIDSCIKDMNFKRNIEEIRKETWANIGKSAELTVDYLIEKYEGVVECHCNIK